MRTSLIAGGEFGELNPELLLVPLSTFICARFYLQFLAIFALLRLGHYDQLLLFIREELLRAVIVVFELLVL